MQLNHARRSGGFSLVELMVALVVGLIVVGAVLALITAIMKSNRETLQSTRLNQELRATMAVIAGDLRRSRGVGDPLTIATSAGGNPYKVIDTSTAGCAVYAYDGAPDGDCRAISVGTGAVWLGAAAPTGGACAVDCDDAKGGTQLNSDQVVISRLEFTPESASATVREFEITIEGHLVDTNPDVSAITRTLTQKIFVRSVGE